MQQQQQLQQKKALIVFWKNLLEDPQINFIRKRMMLRFLNGGSNTKLAQLLSQRAGFYVNLPYDYRASKNMMCIIIRRVDSKQMAAVRDDAAKNGEELYAAGQCAEALIPLQRAIDFGDTTSLALMAWLLISGRKDVPKDCNRAFELAEECWLSATFPAMDAREIMRNRWRWRARAQGCAADTASSRSAGFIFAVQKDLRWITHKRLRFISRLLSRALIWQSA
jgi:hypothetical protein